MPIVNDNELILFHYRDGLAPERIVQIEAALAASPELMARYRALERVLAQMDSDVPPMPDPQFEQRLWHRLQLRLDSTDALAQASPLSVASVSLATSRGHYGARRRRWRVGVAASAGLAALAVWLGGHQLGRQTTEPMRTTSTQAGAITEAGAPAWRASADRILTAQLSDHLRSTQGVLQSVAHSDSATLMPVDDAFLRALAHDNRLYAAAADRRGNRALAGFLKSLDPVLIELANRSDAIDIEPDRSMRDFVRDNDLLFQIRAVQSKLQARQGSSRV